MPAIITHHIFGEDAVGTLPAGMVEGEEELLAFLLGNQGPDPLYARFSTLPGRARSCHRLARSIQGHGTTRAFFCIRDSVSYLPVSDERIGRAFALGLVGHYALDRSAHPLVYAQQFALIDADESLRSGSREVHAIIESDIDSWILWEKRHATVADRPAAADLMRTERIDRVAGALFSQVALSVYGISIGVEEYAGSTRDYELACRVADPAGSWRARMVGGIERLVRPHSLLQSMAHRATGSDECPSANLGRRPWANPFTGVVRHASFADLYDEASLSYPQLAEAFVRGDRERFRQLVGGLNYEGRPGTDE